MPLHVIKQQELAKSTGRAGRVGVRSWSKSRLTSTPTSRPLWYSKQPQLRHRANVLYVGWSQSVDATLYLKRERWSVCDERKIPSRFFSGGEYGSGGRNYLQPAGGTSLLWEIGDIVDALKAS
jgi:hypothetical protein